MKRPLENPGLAGLLAGAGAVGIVAGDLLRTGWLTTTGFCLGGLGLLLMLRATLLRGRSRTKKVS